MNILDTNPNVKGLCKLACELGYKDPFYQLTNSDGSVVGDLLLLLEDNPGACEAIINWLAENYSDSDESEDSDDED